MMASMQGLLERVERVEALEDEVAALRQRLADLEAEREAIRPAL